MFLGRYLRTQGRQYTVHNTKKYYGFWKEHEDITASSLHSQSQILLICRLVGINEPESGES